MKSRILIILLIAIVLSCKDSSEKKNYKVWHDCDELINFIHYSNYKGISSTFGEGRIGKPWDANAGVGTPYMLVKVTFPEVTLNGKVLILTFENSYYSLENLFNKNPQNFHSISCSDYVTKDVVKVEEVSSVEIEVVGSEDYICDAPDMDNYNNEAQKSDNESFFLIKAKQNLQGYLNNIEDERFDANNYFTSTTIQYITLKNITPDEINKSHKRDRSSYSDQVFEYDINTLQKLDNDENTFTMNVHCKWFKKSIEKTQEYDSVLLVMFDDFDSKISSLRFVDYKNKLEY